MEQPLGFSLRWLSVSCFEIHCGDTAIVTDPYITDCAATDLTWEAIERCDMILLSHGHSDHITDIPALTETFRALILCGDQTAMPMARWLNYTPTRIYPAYPGVELDFGDVKVMPLFGRHQEQNRGYNDKLALYGPKYPEEMLPVLYAGCLEYRNYLLTLPNGTRILIWGNDPTEEQKALCRSLRPDAAILQRSAKPEAIDRKGEFAAAIGCKVVIPHHMDTHKPDDPQILQAFEQAYLSRVPDGRFIRPTRNEWIYL